MKQVPSKKDKERFNKAMEAFNNGRLEDALKLFAKVRKNWRDDADIGYLEGLAYGRLGNQDAVEKVSRRALKLSPAHFGALCNLANVQIAKGDAEAALENYDKALFAKPDAPEIMGNYGRALNMLGKRDEAIEFFKKAIAKAPNHAPAHAALGRAYSDAGYPQVAQQEFIQALQIDADLCEAHVGIGSLHAGTGGLQNAEFHYKEALRIEKRNITAYLGLANVERNKGNYDEALRVLEEAKECAEPDNPQLLAFKADMLERKGDKEAAYGILNELAELERMSPVAVAAFSRLCRKFDRCDEALEMIDLSAEQLSTSIMENQTLQYAAGGLLDKLGRYNEAMNYYNRANTLLGIRCDRDGYIKEVDEIIQYTKKDLMACLPRAATGSSRPIFVLGMPRSGTTLTEQIIACHSDVFGAGELSYIKQAAVTITNGSLVRNGDYARFLGDVDQEKLTEIANQYLERLDGLNKEAKYVVDKMPHNFFNVGLIALLFPDARIIHCRRNPLDIGLSIYFQSFIWSHDYALDLGDIGFFYKQYERLMKHWEEVIDIPMMTVQYEDMIQDQEGMSRKLLEFCGLEWNESVMRFYDSKRDVGTASYDQVRRPIYQTSMERWRNYEKHIGPLMGELDYSEKTA